MRANCVITSYSIHYTKLYDTRIIQFILRFFDGIPCCNFPFNVRLGIGIQLASVRKKDLYPIVFKWVMRGADNGTRIKIAVRSKESDAGGGDHP